LGAPRVEALPSAAAGDPPVTGDRVPRRLPPLLFALLAAAYLWALGTPSLWLDEAWEANYYAGFEAAPWYNRPVLYMASVRGLVALLGPSEFVLRLLPCLAGLAAVALTYRLARRGAPRGTSLLAAGILAAADPFLAASHQLKNYAFDALFAVALVLLYLRWRDARTGRRLAAYVAGAAISFGFSFPSIFVVAAAAAVEVGLERRFPRRLAAFGAAHAALAAVFAANFLAFHRGGASDPLLVGYFVEAYAPLQAPWRLPLWLARNAARIVVEQSGALPGYAALLAAAAGVARQGSAGGRTLVGLGVGAALANALASGLALYPFGIARLSVYLAPFAALAVAHGIAALGPERAWSLPRLLAVVAVGLALLGPGARLAASHLAGGWHREEIRDLVARISSARAPDEAILVNDDAVVAFSFYWRRNGGTFPPKGLAIARRSRLDPARHREEVDRVAASGDGAWSLLTHLPREESDALVAMFEERFDRVESAVVGDARLDRWRPRPGWAGGTP